MPQLNRDLMNHLSTQAVARDSIAILDRLQDMPSERLMTERFDISPHDLHTIADNIMNHAQGRRVEFEAVAAYMEGEL